MIIPVNASATHTYGSSVVGPWIIIIKVICSMLRIFKILLLKKKKRCINDQNYATYFKNWYQVWWASPINHNNIR